MSDDVDAAPAEAEPAPKKKKKKKRKKADAAVETPKSRQYPGLADDDVPAFALAYPEDATLDELVLLFEQGRYHDVRERAHKLVHATDRDDVRAAARDLLKRLDPDPLARWLIIGALVLLVFLSGWYWTHPHSP